MKTSLYCTLPDSITYLSPMDLSKQHSVSRLTMHTIGCIISYNATFLVLRVEKGSIYIPLGKVVNV